MEARQDTDPSEEGTPDYILNPEMDMPTQEVDGQSYIGVLELQPLGLSLPIISQWSYPGLRIAPCRYTGSAYQNDLVIAAHNYTSHFGRRWQCFSLSSGGGGDAASLLCCGDDQRGLGSDPVYLYDRRSVPRDRALRKG